MIEINVIYLENKRSINIKEIMDKFAYILKFYYSISVIQYIY